MADKIATESEASYIGKISSTNQPLKCCTAERARELNCVVSVGYSSNRLVPLTALSSPAMSYHIKVNLYSTDPVTFVGPIFTEYRPDYIYSLTFSDLLMNDDYKLLNLSSVVHYCNKEASFELDISYRDTDNFVTLAPYFNYPPATEDRGSSIEAQNGVMYSVLFGMWYGENYSPKFSENHVDKYQTITANSKQQMYIGVYQ